MIPPTAFPDSVHVANGCYLSAVVYLVRFRAAFPRESGLPVAVTLTNRDGSDKGHTVALVTWHGEWWARDEYYGVLRLRFPAMGALDPCRLRAILEHGFQRRAAFVARDEGGLPDDPDWSLSQVRAAAALLPFPSEVHWVGRDRGFGPVLFFRQGSRGFAVYDPAVGTATAESDTRDPDRLVEAVALRTAGPRSSSSPQPAASSS